MARKYKNSRNESGLAPEGLRKVTLLIPNEIFLLYRQTALELEVTEEELMSSVLTARLINDETNDEKASSDVPTNSSLEHNYSETTTSNDEDEGNGRNSIPRQPTSSVS
jgi:hypothetical protein